MTVTAGDVLAPAKVSVSLARYWRGADVGEVADVVHRDLEIAGTVLPLVKYDGQFVFPIVKVRVDAVRHRLADQLDPILDRGRLRTLALHEELAPPPAITMQAFLTVSPFPAARTVLGGLSGWARVIAALPSWAKIPPVQAAACDYYGHTVVSCDGDTARVLVDGHRGAAPGSSTERDPWQLLKEEQLFDLAIRGGLISWR
jgi:hypothetical protein